MNTDYIRENCNKINQFINNYPNIDKKLLKRKTISQFKKFNSKYPKILENIVYDKENHILRLVDLIDKFKG